MKYKNNKNEFCCHACGSNFITKWKFSRHIKIIHNLSHKEYYDIYFKKRGDGICVCGKNTKFDNYTFLYRKYCSKKCMSNDPNVIKKRSETVLRKYGVNNISQSTYAKNKKSITCFKNYGVDNPSKSKKINHIKVKSYMEKYGVTNPNQSEIIKDKKKRTCMRVYGTETPFSNKEVRKKGKITLIKNYGVDNPSQSRTIKDKKEQTCLRNYGVKYPSQNREICDKQCKSALQSKPYVLPSGKIIYIMGYEPKFLNYVFKNKILKEDEIDYRPKTIKYVGVDKKEHYYHPDFFIQKWNLIIEIKSKRTIELDLDVYNKEKYTRKNGFKYMRIVDNNFNKFYSFSINHGEDIQG